MQAEAIVQEPPIVGQAFIPFAQMSSEQALRCTAELDAAAAAHGVAPALALRWRPRLMLVGGEVGLAFEHPITDQKVDVFGTRGTYLASEARLLRVAEAVALLAGANNPEDILAARAAEVAEDARQEQERLTQSLEEINRRAELMGVEAKRAEAWRELSRDVRALFRLASKRTGPDRELLVEIARAIRDESERPNGGMAPQIDFQS